MCPKQALGYFLVFSSLINFVRLKYSATKNVCSKQVGGCFLVHTSLISIVHLKCFYYNFYKTSVEGYFLNCCFLFYLANYIKLLGLAAF